MDYEYPFLSWELNSSDPGYEGSQIESQRLFQRSDELDRLMRTGKHPDVLLDMLEAHGQDPVAYVEAVEANVDAVIRQGIVPDGLEFTRDCRADKFRARYI